MNFKNITQSLEASTMLLPIAELYRLTGKEEYLLFSRYIIREIDNIDGPQLIGHLLAGESIESQFQEQPNATLMTLRGLAMVGFLTKNDVWLLSVKNAIGQIDKVLELSFAKAKTNSSAKYQSETMLLWLQLKVDGIKYLGVPSVGEQELAKNLWVNNLP